MEYALAALLYIFKYLFDAMFQMELPGGRSYGAVYLALFVLFFVLPKFAFKSGKSGKSKKFENGKGG